MVKKSFAKVNIFLKIVGVRDNYHLLASRFVLVKDLYDEVSFIEKSVDSFTLKVIFHVLWKRIQFIKRIKN